jgi:hypothetical protein
LKCCTANLFVRHRRFEVEKGFDVSTHKRYLNLSEPPNEPLVRHGIMVGSGFCNLVLICPTLRLTSRPYSLF